MRTWVFPLLMLCVATGCGGSSTAPEPVDRLVIFQDPDSAFSTTDVHDAQEQVVQFNSANDTLIWTATGAAFAGWDTNGSFLDASRQFMVRFGSKRGQRLAYFTERRPPDTICDIQVTPAGQLVIVPTDVPVP